MFREKSVWGLGHSERATGARENDKLNIGKICMYFLLKVRYWLYLNGMRYIL